MRRLLVAATLVVAPAQAQGYDPKDPVTGNGILSICSQDDPVSRTACGLYIRGMLYTLTTLEEHGQMQRVECSPDTTTANQQRDIFISYLRANPQTRHLGSPLLFMRSLAQAFPCPPGQALPSVQKKM